MEFIEKDETIRTIEIPTNQQSFVYFLLNNNEVVYVGQTRQGLTRPLAHTDKQFNRIKILPCKVEMLNVIESFYIDKYKPKYNRTIVNETNFKLERMRDEIRKIYRKDYTVKDLKWHLFLLHIKPYRQGGHNCIKIEDGKKLIDFLCRKQIKEYKKEQIKEEQQQAELKDRDFINKSTTYKFIFNPSKEQVIDMLEWRRQQIVESTEYWKKSIEREQKSINDNKEEIIKIDLKLRNLNLAE